MVKHVLWVPSPARDALKAESECGTFRKLEMGSMDSGGLKARATRSFDAGEDSSACHSLCDSEPITLQQSLNPFL